MSRIRVKLLQDGPSKPDRSGAIVRNRLGTYGVRTAFNWMDHGVGITHKRNPYQKENLPYESMVLLRRGSFVHHIYLQVRPPACENQLRPRHYMSEHLAIVCLSGFAVPWWLPFTFLFSKHSFFTPSQRL